MRWVIVAVVAEALAIIVLGVAVIYLWTRPTEDTAARRDITAVEATLDAQRLSLIKSRREAYPYQQWTSIVCKQLGGKANAKTLATYTNDLAATFITYLVKICDYAAVPAKSPTRP